MKTSLLLTFLSFVCISVASAAEVEGRVTSYGIFKVAGDEEIVKSPETPTGVTKIPTDATLVVTTNRIPAKIGVQFGMWFEVNNVAMPDGEVELASVMTHPLMTKPDGTTSKGYTTVMKFKVKGGRIVGWSGYGFEYSYELATGNWQLEMQFKGKTVCKQTFTVFKE